MTFAIHRTPIEENLLEHLARDLTESLPNAQNGDFSGALVILPSSRACLTLGHVLLENHPLDTLLLPKTMTMTQLIEELSLATGKTTGDLPDDLVRPLILAHHLRDESWLKDRPESAPGLAEEFVALFDEVRLYGCAAEVLEDGPVENLTSHVHAEAAADLEADLLRIRRVWELYRQCVGRDRIDRLCELADGLDGSLQPALGRDLLMVAGFANLDPTRATLLRNLGQWSEESRLYLPQTTSPLSRFFTDTWVGSETNPTQPGGLDPLAPSRLVVSLLAAEAKTDPAPTPTRTLRQKVAELGEAQGVLQPDGPLRLLACGTSEDESQFVANQVVEILKTPGGNKEKTAVVTNDPVLAARVVAQLRDAGVDTDQTLGAPLSSLPAGLLLRFLLRTALTDFRSENLLEVLTHPYVKLAAADGKIEKWNLRLENMLRRHVGGQPGADGMLKLARIRDEAAQRLYDNEAPGMEAFVEAVLQAFAPLTALPGTRTWGELIPAVTSVWNNLCPDEPLEENKEKSDITAVARLFSRLAANNQWLPQVHLGELASDLGRFLSAESVAPHRGQAKPVLVTGTVEARLEKYDHLLLAGMAEGSFPARRRRPLFFNSGLRRHLGLPDWRQAVSRDAALFLRLLHNAPNVLVTWPTEGDGRMVLPSPFVARLALALPDQKDPAKSAMVPLWRKREENPVDVLQSQEQFAAETPGPKSSEKIRPLNRLSWSSLSKWRDCPYRHLLEKGFLLQKEEEVREEFGRRDYGDLVHKSLYAFLIPGGPGYDALLGGYDKKAREILAACAHTEFLDKGEDTASRRLWLANFLKCAPAIVEYEMTRFKEWRPVLLEQSFVLPLADVLSWLEKQNKAGDLGLEIPEVPTMTDPVVLRGAIDRVDEKVTDLDPQRKVAAIVDYKTGKLPSNKDVLELKDLQILLYAVALEAGAVPGAPEGTWLTAEGFYYEISETQAGPPKKPHLPCGDSTGRALLAEGALALVQMAMGAADPDQEFPLIPEEMAGEGEKSLPCRYCAFRGVCRLEERLSGNEATALKVDKMVNRKEGAW
jgi:PD-(D/E)XK nuclease superfamily